MSRCERGDFKGNLLKMVTTRIDYQDLYELSGQTVKDIRKLCVDVFQLSNQGYRSLEGRDFELNDPVGFTHLPYDYLKDINSYIFYNSEEDLKVELNQLFLEVTHKVSRHYRGYDDILLFLQQALGILFMAEKINIKRVAIKKSNQVFLQDYREFRRYFDENLLKFNQFNGMIDWGLPNSQISTVENFKFDDIFVNFKKLFQNGKIKKEKYYRLYLEYEAYLTNFDFNEQNIARKIVELNDGIFKLFKYSLTDEAKEKLKNDERIGDIE